MSAIIKTENYGSLELITTDSHTGEGTGDIRLEIESIYCSAWIHLEYSEIKKLRDELSNWLEEN